MNNTEKEFMFTIKGEFETVMMTKFPRDWNFRWDCERNDYVSSQMSWMFVCYCMGKTKAISQLQPNTPKTVDNSN